MGILHWSVISIVLLGLGIETGYTIHSIESSNKEEAMIRTSLEATLREKLSGNTYPFVTNQNGRRNAEITGLDANYISVATKPNVIHGLAIERCLIKAPKVGDSVWVSFIPLNGRMSADSIYRDSRKIPE